MVVRYAIMVALAAASVRALFDVSATQAPMLLVDAGHTAAAPVGASSDIAFWLLAAIATLITLSLGRFVFFDLPSMVGEEISVVGAFTWVSKTGGAIDHITIVPVQMEAGA